MSESGESSQLQQELISLAQRLARIEDEMSIMIHTQERLREALTKLKERLG